MKRILILTLFLPFLSFSQNLIGTWVKTNENEIGIQFQENGNLELIDLKQPENKVLKNITIKYRTIAEDKTSYIEIEIFNQNKLIETKKLKYLLNKEKLYLPNFLEENNIETTLDNKDEYAKLIEKNNPNLTANEQIEVLTKKELEAVHKKQNNLGSLIATIEFEVQATGDDLKDFEDGIIPWISIEHPKSEIDKLMDSDEIVIPYSEIYIIIDYPLNKPTSFVLKNSKNGFTKKELILEISKKYHEIYQIEETTATTKTIPVDNRKGIINRNETNGNYGIWGHDLGDLVLSSIEVYKSENGKIQLLLGIES